MFSFESFGGEFRMEKRGGRSSASPQRLSLSPKSSSNTYLSHRELSVPGKVLSTANNPSSVIPQSTIANARRMSPGSTATPCSSESSGASPGKVTHGNSVSPKLQPWQATLPGCSSDPPPNLRTSMTDRAASRVGGLSPPSSGKNALT